MGCNRGIKVALARRHALLSLVISIGSHPPQYSSWAFAAAALVSAPHLQQSPILHPAATREGVQDLAEGCAQGGQVAVVDAAGVELAS